uniref:Cyclin-D-binding Myb-like transcription factor 1 n=1 Tax=Arundo donax TaxID=35708 RepID=A0A0A9CL21_ARUDO
MLVKKDRIHWLEEMVRVILKSKRRVRIRMGVVEGTKKKVSQRKDKGRRVSFTDDVEVFNIDGCDNEEGDGSGESRLVHGKRFTPEEDAKIMEAMVNYAEMKQLGEKGLEMIAACIKHPETRGCWAEIATSLPHRPVMAIYKRARILLHRSAERKWTQEEYETIRRFVEQNGTNWKKLAMELGKSEIHVKDFWRRMKPKNLKKGIWTQDEYQNLFDLVNLDLRVKAHQKFDHGHRLIRDNISWEAISDKLTTRSHHECCLKWYRQLTSPLVKQGIWADTDDYLLVEALQRVDAVCAEDVDWDSLLDDRSGEVCRQRWNQMVRMMGGHREKPFIEQVEVLSRRYCPEMLDYRT